MNQKFNEHFGAKNEKIYSASAHGSLDIMGGFASYSGSLILKMPIHEKTTVSIRKTNDSMIKIKSFMENGLLDFTVPCDNFKSVSVDDYKSIQQLLEKDKWVTYVVGCLILLNWEKKIELSGFEILIETEIPMEKELCSSTALGIATLKVFQEFYDLKFKDNDLPFLAIKVENLIAGKTSGVENPLASYFGKPHELFPIICQPDIWQDSIPLPKDVYLMGIDSGVTQSLGKIEHEKVRTATFMGYTILANLEGINTKNIKQLKREELPFGGYLCNVRVPYFNANFSRILPKTMTGHDFISQYGEIYDESSSIDLNEKYPILNVTRHAIFENNRVEKFKKACLSIDKTLSKKIPYKLMGSFMDESNSSYSACGLGCKETDELVQLAYLARNKGVYGARVTGNGLGGIVAILCVGEKGKQAVREIWTQFQERNKIEVKLFGQ